MKGDFKEYPKGIAKEGRQGDKVRQLAAIKMSDSSSLVIKGRFKDRTVDKGNENRRNHSVKEKLIRDD